MIPVNRQVLICAYGFEILLFHLHSSAVQVTKWREKNIISLIRNQDRFRWRKRIRQSWHLRFGTPWALHHQSYPWTGHWIPPGSRQSSSRCHTTATTRLSHCLKKENSPSSDNTTKMCPLYGTHHHSCIQWSCNCHNHNMECQAYSRHSNWAE